MSREEYDALKRTNFSRLKLLAKSPAHYLHGFGPESAPMRLGTAAHAATLEPAKFASGFVVYKKRRQSKEWDAFEAAAERAGQTVLTEAEHVEAVAMAAAIRNHPVASRLLSGGNAEVSLTWDIEVPAVG